MSANEQLARQLADAEFAAALAVIKRTGRNHERAVKLADVVEDFMRDLDGMHGLLHVEDKAAELVMALNLCHAQPEQLSVYGRVGA